MTRRQPTAEGFVERAGVRLHWLEWAPDPARARLRTGAQVPPALFLLHGLSSNARYWERLARRFPHRRVVALDQRAHGASSAPETGYSMDDLTADAVAVIDALQLERPAVAGHSWGATVALDLAATRPEHVSGLAVLDGPLAAFAERMSWEDASRLMQPPLPRYRTLEEAHATTRELLGAAWDSDLEEFVDAGLMKDGDAYVLTLTAPVRLQILDNLYHFQPEAAWAAVQAPILVAVAGADAGLRQWKEEGARRLSEARPDADIRWYDSQHDIPLIRADELATDVERLALRAGLADAVRLAGALTGDWSRPATEGWSAKELLAHVSSSLAAMPKVLEAPPAAPGAEPGPAFDADRWNASMVRRRAELPPQSLVAELQSAVEELDSKLRSDDLSQTVHTGPDSGRPLADVMHVAVTHAHGHLAEVAAALVADLV